MDYMENGPGSVSRRTRSVRITDDGLRSSIGIPSLAFLAPLAPILPVALCLPTSGHFGHLSPERATEIDSPANRSGP